MRRSELNFCLLLWPFALGYCAAVISFGAVILSLPAFVVGIGLQLRHDEALGRNSLFFPQFALLFLGVIGFLYSRGPLPTEPHVNEVFESGYAPRYVDFPSKQVLLSEAVRSLRHDPWLGWDPGTVIELLDSSLDPRVVRAVLEVRLGAQMGTKASDAFTGVAQTLCLDRLPMKQRAAFVLYPDARLLRAMLRNAGISECRDFDLASLYPGFQARDITPVPGRPSEFAIWGADQVGAFRMLRFDLAQQPLGELDQMLLADIRHPSRAAPLAACAQPEIVDQAWYVRAGSGELCHYRFDADRIELVPGIGRQHRLNHVIYLAVNWAWPGELGQPFSIRASRSRSGTIDWVLRPQDDDEEPQVTIWMEADGRRVRSSQGFLRGS